MSAPSAPLTPVPPGHGIVLAPDTRLADEGHLLLGGRPTRVVRLSSPQVSALLCWMAGAIPSAPEARALAAHLVAAGLAHPAPPPGEPQEGGSGGDDVLVLVPVGVCPEPGWLAPALAHLDDPRVGAVVPSAVVDEQDRGDAGPFRAGLAALLTRLTLPEAFGASEASTLPEARGGQAVEHACDDPPRRVPALVVRRSALPAPGAAPPAPEADTAHLPPAGVLSRTLPPTLPGALVAAGWSVRHEPCSRVRVEPLRGFGAYLSASFELGQAAGEGPGSATGPGERAAGPPLSWAGVAGLALALSGRPAGGACVALAGYTAAAAAHLLPPATAVRAVGASASDDARALVRAAEQGWAPVAGALALRHPVAAAAVVASAALAGRSTPARSAAVAAGAVARSAGTWWGAWRARSVAALVPRVYTPLTARRPSRN